MLEHCLVFGTYRLAVPFIQSDWLLVPRRRIGFRHAGRKEFHHVARFVGSIGHSPMPKVVVRDGHGTGVSGEWKFVAVLGTFRSTEVVAPRNDARGAQLYRRVLWIVENQQSACTMRPAFAAILMQILTFASRLINVRVAMGLHVVIRAQETR